MKEHRLVPDLTLAPPGAVLSLFNYPRLRVGLWRRDGRLSLPAASVTLAECLAPRVRNCLHRLNSSASCSASLGHSRAARRRMIFRPGPSATTGRQMFRSPKPRSTSSSAGLATCSTSCSSHTHDLTRRHLP